LAIVRSAGGGILPARAASLFGNDCEAIENARGRF
jgi:hypothetical protein